MHGIAGQIDIPGNNVGRIQARSQPGVAFPKRRLTTPPLGEQGRESERSHVVPSMAVWAAITRIAVACSVESP